MTKPPSTKDPTGSPRSGEESGPAPEAGGDLLSECRIDTFRSGGKGGQHQNKVESGVRLTHRPSGIVVTSRRFRSQHRNREEALERLSRKLDARSRAAKPRVPTQVTRAQKRKRLEAKRKRSRLKALRAKPGEEDA